MNRAGSTVISIYVYEVYIFAAQYLSSVSVFGRVVTLTVISRLLGSPRRFLQHSGKFPPFPEEAIAATTWTSAIPKDGGGRSWVGS